MAAKRAKTAHADHSMRLMSLGRASFVSKSGIAKLLKDVEDNGIPDTYDRSAQYRARKDICNTETPYGRLVENVVCQGTNGKDFPIPFQNPLAFIAYHAENSPHYAEILERALAKKPCTPSTPWKVILYQDGVDPSDGLAKNHSRKSCVFYWSIAEFGLHALAHEEVWGTITIMRSLDTKNLEGGIGTLTHKVLEQFFNEVNDIRKAGVSLRIKAPRQNGEHVNVTHVFCEIGVLLADEPALKEMLDCKGHAGHKCCVLCANCSLHTLEHPLTERSDYWVGSDSTNWADFEKHNDDSLRNTVRALHNHHAAWKAKRMKKEQYDEKSACLGFNFNAKSIILNTCFMLGIASIVMYDWAHTYVCDGLADTELGQCMKAMHTARTPTRFSELGEYVASFTFPRNCGNPNHLFTESANRNNAANGGFTCSASEFLSLAPILHRYFSRVVQPRGFFLPLVLSMIAVLEVVMLLQAVKTGQVTPDALWDAIVRHLRLYKEAYGSGKMRPKHHYALHLPDMLRRFGFLLATFTHERKHRIVKRHTRDRCNLRSWALGALEDITCHQIWEMSLPFFMSLSSILPTRKALMSLREMFPGLSDDAFSLHRSIKCNGGQCDNGDVMSFLHEGDICIGELLMTVGVFDGREHTMWSFFALWQPWGASTSADELPGWGTLLMSDEHVVKVPMAHIDTVFLYRAADDRKSCLAYAPYEIRVR